jgi:hypothetical protein
VWKARHITGLGEKKKLLRCSGIKKRVYVSQRWQKVRETPKIANLAIIRVRTCTPAGIYYLVRYLVANKKIWSFPKKNRYLH